MIGQILEYKTEFLFMIQSVNLPPSAHTITSSAHCSTLQPSAACSQPFRAHPVHTHCSSHYIFSAHCSQSSVHTAANLQCTLQPCTAMYSYLQPTFSAHCSYTIQCTLQLHYLVPILYSTSSAPLNHHRVSLYHYWPTSRAVSIH